MRVAGPQANFWLRRARRLAAFVNLVRWIEWMVPWVVAIHVLLCCALIYVRVQGLPVIWFPGVWLGACVLAGLAVGLRVWFRRWTRADALLRMETALGLDNRLTLAHAGRVRWPDPQMDTGGFYVWSWRRPLAVFTVSLLVLAGGFLAPFRSPTPSALAENPSPPLALAEVEDWVAQLEEENLIEDPALESLREAVDDLKKRPPDEWYTAGALEAAENLNAQTQAALASLARELRTSSAALSGAAARSPSLTTNELESLESVFRESLAAMKANALPLSSEALEQLAQVDFKKLAAMDPAELERLKGRSEQWAQMCEAFGGMSEGEKEWLEQYYKSLREGSQGEGERRAAPGGIERGRGDAEMSYSPYRSEDSVGRTEAVSNQDLRNAALGDTVRTTVSDQKEAAAGFTGPRSGGEVDSVGSGGEAVWIDHLTPAERQVLRENF